MTSLDDLNSAQALWDWLSAISAQLVIFGVALESVAAFPRISKLLGIDWNDAKDALARRGAFVLIVGLAAELVTANVSHNINNHIVALLNKEAADARLAAANLEKQYAPRRLSRNQRYDLAYKLVKYAGTRVNIVGYKDIEPWVLEDQIQTALGTPAIGVGAGWDVSSVIGYERNSVFEGVLIEVEPGASPSDRIAAKALVDALTSEGLFAIGPSPRRGILLDIVGGRSNPNAKIWLTVGAKEEPRIAIWDRW